MTTPERRLQPGPVGNWATYNGLQGAADGSIKLGSGALDVTGRAGAKDEGDLGEGKARAQKGALTKCAYYLCARRWAS